MTMPLVFHDVRLGERATRRAIAFVVAPLSLSAIACGDLEGGVCPAPTERAPHAISYRLAWEDAPGSAREGGGTEGPVTVETDLGYTVTLERGELTSYSAQLVPCTHAELAALSPAGEGAACDDAAATAQPASRPLGHGTGENDTSAVNVVTVEPLLGPGLDFGTALADATFYCRAHYLTGPVTSPTDGGVFGLTLWLEGSYRAPGSASDTPFALTSKSAYGAFFALGNSAADPESGAPATVAYDSGLTPAEIVITRPRGLMFDGIELATTPPEEAGKAILGLLIKQSRATLLF